MKLTDLTKGAGEWLRGAGPMGEIVISSRIRLARNVAGYPFLAKCSESQRRELVDTLREHIARIPLGGDSLFIDVDSASELDRQLLVERHLISRHHAEASGARAVVVSGDETASIMVNEEDHLRLQVLRSGLQLHDTYDQIDRLDNQLEQRLNYAFSGRFGYLTACPTNVGTGMRVSVMLHLPALRMTGEIEKVVRAARDMHLAIRGLYGEGTEATGDFFQVSNQTTLGRSERQIIDDFRDQVIPQIIDYEHQARHALLDDRALAIDDKVHRALAILRAARLISSEETMHLLSHLRLGVNLRRVRDVDLLAVNELFLLTQPAHLQRIAGKELSPIQRAELRAEYIRSRLN